MTLETLLEPPIEEQEIMPSLEHGIIGSRLNRFLDVYVDDNNLGAVCTSQTSFKFIGKPITRYPDISFISLERLPEQLRTDADFAPDLAVEVVSKGDDDYDLEEKIIQYQKSGVRLIWIVHPVSQTVEVYRLSTGLRSFRLVGEDELLGEEVIPGFKVKVSRLFDLPRKIK